MHIIFSCIVQAAVYDPVLTIIISKLCIFEYTRWGLLNF